MATFDMTAKATTGVSASSSAINQADRAGQSMRMIEAVLDMDALTADGYSCTNGDIFQLLEVPVNTFILFAGAEVLKVFDGSSPTVDIDFAAGDDFVDGQTAASTGYKAAGSYGHVDYTAVATFANRITATDTLDVKVGAGANDVSTGKVRVYAVLVDISGVDETDSLKIQSL